MKLKDILPDYIVETKRCEFKARLNDEEPNKWLKTIAAFANTNGGDFFIGVADKTTVLNGFLQEELDNQIRLINGKMFSHLLPVPETVFRYLPYQDGDEVRYIIEISVPRGKILPVLTKDDDSNILTYVRREGYTDQATAEEIRNMARSSASATFDTMNSDEAFKVGDFQRLFAAYKDRNDGKDLSPKTLQGIGFFDESGILKRGAVLFEDNCVSENTKVHCRAWGGVGKGSSRVIDDKEKAGNLIDQIAFAIDFIKAHSNTGYIKTGDGREDVDSYPERSVLEAVVNAVAHRDYLMPGTQIDIDVFQDRLEIVSPGGMVNGDTFLDKKDIESIPSKRRNSLVCDVLGVCKLMEKGGTGFEKIVEDYGQYPAEYAPSISAGRDYFKIVLKDLTFSEGIPDVANDISEFTPLVGEGNRDYDEKILRFCYEEPHSAQEIADHIGMVRSKYFRDAVLNPLIQMEYLLGTSKNKKSPNNKYRTNKALVVF